MALVIPRRSDLSRLFCIAQCMDLAVCFLKCYELLEYTVSSTKCQWHLRDEGIILSNCWFWIKIDSTAVEVGGTCMKLAMICSGTGSSKTTLA